MQVLAGAGAVDHDELVDMAKAAFSNLPSEGISTADLIKQVRFLTSCHSPISRLGSSFLASRMPQASSAQPAVLMIGSLLQIPIEQMHFFLVNPSPPPPLSCPDISSLASHMPQAWRGACSAQPAVVMIDSMLQNPIEQMQSSAPPPPPPPPFTGLPHHSLSFFYKGPPS